MSLIFTQIFYIRPLSAINDAVTKVQSSGADSLVAVGGGSPIDSAKAIAFKIHEATGKWLPTIAIPTTLSVAETTQNAGVTDENKVKKAVSDPELVPKGKTLTFLLFGFVVDET